VRRAHRACTWPQRSRNSASKLPGSRIPPPGRPMAFPEWSEAIVDSVRRYLPDARAVGKQPKRTCDKNVKSGCKKGGG
jgi:hypothetical protein